MIIKLNDILLPIINKLEEQLNYRVIKSDKLPSHEFKYIEFDIDHNPTIIDNSLDAYILNTSTILNYSEKTVNEIRYIERVIIPFNLLEDLDCVERNIKCIIKIMLENLIKTKGFDEHTWSVGGYYASFKGSGTGTILRMHENGDFELRLYSDSVKI